MNIWKFAKIFIIAFIQNKLLVSEIIHFFNNMFLDEEWFTWYLYISVYQRVEKIEVACISTHLNVYEIINFITLTFYLVYACNQMLLPNSLPLDILCEHMVINMCRQNCAS